MEITIKGTKCQINFDLSTEPVLSKSGKSLVLASTHGFVKAPNGRRLSLNLIEPAPQG